MTNVPGPRRGLDVFFDRLRGIGYQRDTSNKWIGGVCSGLAARWGIDPLLVRSGFVVLGMFTGFGPLPYLVALALMPDQHGRIWAESALRGDDGKAVTLVVIIGLVLAGEISDRPWPWILVPVALVGWWVLHKRRRGQSLQQVADEARARASSFLGRQTPAPPGTQTPPPPYAGPAPSGGGASSDGDGMPFPGTASPGTPSPGTPSPGTPFPGTPFPGTSAPGSLGPWGPHGPQDAPLAGSTPSYPAAGPTASATSTAYPGPRAYPSPPAGGPTAYPVGPRGPHGMGPGRTGALAAPPVVRAQRRRAGFLAFLVITGLALAAAGESVSVAHRRGIAYTDLAVGGAAAVLVAGLALIVLGLRGRRAPFLTFLSMTTAAVVAVAALLPPSFTPAGGLTTVGEQVWVPEDGTPDAATDYRLGAGDAVLDLRKLTAAANAKPVSANLLMGELTVVVPAGLVVRIDATAGLGDVDERALRPAEATQTNPKFSTSGTMTLASGAQLVKSVLVGSGDPDVVVTARVGFGEIHILRADGATLTDLTAAGGQR